VVSVARIESNELMSVSVMGNGHEVSRQERDQSGERARVVNRRVQSQRASHDVFQSAQQRR
jgi:hypothetical protein